jgi:hypothetical protein
LLLLPFGVDVKVMILVPGVFEIEGVTLGAEDEQDQRQTGISTFGIASPVHSFIINPGRDFCFIALELQSAFPLSPASPGVLFHPHASHRSPLGKAML